MEEGSGVVGRGVGCWGREMGGDRCLVTGATATMAGHVGKTTLVVARSGH